ncbi:MAG TPA: hypothetical protein VJ276_05255 [Thermoanaerobaculia bacterium]|nr:hypothetical protein [Thermoanaerobaculia bacterium]
MKKLLILAAFIATSALAQKHPATAYNFASDLQTVPVMANTMGVGGAQFQTSVALFNPTASAFPVTATLYDGAGSRRDAVIQLAAGELKTFANFLDEVFHTTGGGAVVFQSGDSAKRFIVSTDIRTGRFSTTIPVSEFAGSSSRSFAAGITVDSTSRTNVGCLNQSGNANAVKATIYDNSGKQVLGSLTLNLLPNAWGQAGVTTIVNGGYVQFDPSDAALCYAVVVDNSTNDGRFISAAEYQP